MTVTRFAPSPTGRLHLGHAFSAVTGHTRARQNGGSFLLRIEDLDQTRSRPEHVSGIFEDLRWLGLDWDGEPVVQSGRTAAYEQALGELRRLGVIYPCFCTRADIAAALSAPHGPAGAAYPGTCKALADDPKRRKEQPHSWRLDAAAALDRTGPATWREEGRGRMTADAPEDVILARKDAPASYHLACVVDDAAGGIDLVVRGEDLRDSTPVQRLLQMLLGLPEPLYHHHALVLHEDGRRLAKRDHAPTLHALRQDGVDGRALADRLRMGKVPYGFRLTST